MKKLTREKILKMIKKELRAKEDLTASLLKSVSETDSAQDVVCYGERLSEVLIEASTLECLLEDIAKKESK